ncbi:MAG: hypothetical protein ABSG18_13875 [Steroidobacteraceae bacterium]|jgi:hypothetical protein
MRAAIAALLATASIVICAPASAQSSAVQPGVRDAPHNAGIWKAAVPPKPMKGEFDSMDPLGVAAGAGIKADCSLNWIDPDDGALYCFSSGTSLEFFMDHPKASIERARQGWQKLRAKSSFDAE